MTEPTANMTVDGDRLWDSLMEMARIGPGVAGGNNRQTVTDEDGEGRALLQRWCEVQQDVEDYFRKTLPEVFSPAHSPRRVYLCHV